MLNRIVHLNPVRSNHFLENYFIPFLNHSALKNLMLYKLWNSESCTTYDLMSHAIDLGLFLILHLEILFYRVRASGNNFLLEALP